MLPARGTAVVGSLWVRLYLMFRCSSPANKLISVTFLGEFSFGCLPFSFSKQSVLGYGVRERVTFPKLPVSRTGRLLCWTDPGPRPHVRDSARGAPSVSPFLIPTFRAAHLCAGRARTHCCVLCAALPSCLSARRPPPGTPPAPNSVFCQPAFRHGEGSALCILLTVVSCFLYEGTVPGPVGASYLSHQNRNECRPSTKPVLVYTAQVPGEYLWDGRDPLLPRITAICALVFYSLISHEPAENSLGLFCVPPLRGAEQGAFLTGDSPQICAGILDTSFYSRKGS